MFGLLSTAKTTGNIVYLEGHFFTFQSVSGSRSVFYVFQPSMEQNIYEKRTIARTIRFKKF